MGSRQSSRSRSGRPVRSPSAEKPALAAEHLSQRSLNVSPASELPVIPVRSPTRHPYLYRKRLGTFDRRARHGDLVRLVLGEGEHFGYGLFNPRAEITVRLLTTDPDPPGEDWWRKRIEGALAFRSNVLHVDKDATAYRIIHAEADGLPGLIVDRLGDVLSVEVFSLAVFQRIDALLGMMTAICGVEDYVVRCGPQTLEQEGFTADMFGSSGLRPTSVIEEHGVRFRIDHQAGHKTGFFCDQRDNRRRLAELTAEKTVLDACCYTGGFALNAAVRGNAAEVTGVDLDESAIETARGNANLNQTRVRFVHADAFAYLRDMLRNERRYDVVVLDPPKFILNRDEHEIGRQKYFDLNRLAMQLIEPGGWLLSCTCSGLLPVREFQQTVAAAVPPGRTARIVDRTGAAPDHPIAANCLETEYLQALWLQVD